MSFVWYLPVNVMLYELKPPSLTCQRCSSSAALHKLSYHSYRYWSVHRDPDLRRGELGDTLWRPVAGAVQEHGETQRLPHILQTWWLQYRKYCDVMDTRIFMCYMSLSHPGVFADYIYYTTMLCNMMIQDNYDSIIVLHLITKLLFIDLFMHLHRYDIHIKHVNLLLYNKCYCKYILIFNIDS